MRLHALLLSGAWGYSARVDAYPKDPVIGFTNDPPHTSSFVLAFNPTYVEMSPGTGNADGLLVRVQNCSAPKGECRACAPTVEDPSRIAFVHQGCGEPEPCYFPLTDSDVVLGPNSTADVLGLADPRIVYHNGTYYMTYLAIDKTGATQLELATSPDPTGPSHWTKLGSVFGSAKNATSGSILPSAAGHHVMLVAGSGDTRITAASSSDLHSWVHHEDKVVLEPRSTGFDAGRVEAGPSPMVLTDGNYVLFYNAAEEEAGVLSHVGYAVLSGADPTKVLFRGTEPLISAADRPWTSGGPGYVCSEQGAVKLDGGVPIPAEDNAFRLYFGAGGAYVGTVKVVVDVSASVVV